MMEGPDKMTKVDFMGLSDKDDNEFSKFLQRPHPSEIPRREDTLPSLNQQKARKLSDKNHAPYVSFGDRGTTASAGVYGSLLRICQPVQNKYSDHIQSKLVGLGPLDDPEAWYVYWRTAQFLENSLALESGVGLSVMNTSSPKLPSVEFLENRWPLISYETKDFVVEVRLWCQNSVIVQQTRVTNEWNRGEILNLELNPNFSLQDLDYQEKRKPIPVHRDRGPHGYGLIVLDNSPHLTIDDQRMCVLLSFFKNGVAQQLPLNIGDSEIKPIHLSHRFDRKNTVEFTLLFKFQMSTVKADWRHFMISPDELDFEPQSHSVDGLSNLSTVDPELNWHLSRNLEHIMSVCSVPLATETEKPVARMIDEEIRDPGIVRLDSKREQPAAPMVVLQDPDGQRDVIHRGASTQARQVALTCGDFGDHRVSVSGSYFAFMFMLAMHEKLPHAPGTRNRIHEICRGHLEWVSQLDIDEACSSNVRIDGRRLSNSGETALPPDNPANMPSYIIRATQYLEVFSALDDLLFVCSWLGQFVVKWFEKLVQEKNPLTPTWQHLEDSEIPVYRLSDQVWIWKALKNVEELIQRLKRKEGTVAHTTLEEFLQIASHLPGRGVQRPSSGLMLDFTAEEVRRQNLRRFTIDNDILKKRMLSVTRTTRETRFLLHSRDTFLYYGLEWGFFAGEETLWENLISAQTQHDEASNDQSQWDNPLRYGLALEMAKQGHQLERTFTPSEMFAHAKQILLSSSSENGLFPGQLDDFSKEATLFDRELFRDFYFHVGFEIPYILLRTMEEPDLKKARNPTDDEEPRRTRSRVDEPQSPRRRPTFTEPATGALPGYLNIQPDGRAVAIQQTLKRQNPYGRLVDLSNIVEVPEEWLYKYPDFLGFTPPRNKEEVEKNLKEALKVIQKDLYDMEDAALDCMWLVVDNSRKEADMSMNGCYATIDDVRKGRKQRKWSVEEKSLMTEHRTHRSLWGHLERQRNAGDSKKRLIYLSSPDSIIAAMCYVSSPELERVHISQFFDRHAKVDANFLYDDTAAVFNTWVTEVHFRFFQIFTPEKEDMPSQNLPRVRQLKSQICRVFGSKSYLVDAVVSFRIVGDFFDRYWTCHIVQNFANLDAVDHPLSESERRQSAHWQQRKVLELILLNHILDKACSSANIILRSIEQGPRLTTSDAGEKYFSKDNFEDRKPEELRESFQLLVILKKNFTSLQVLIEQWNHRESSQGRERPRWTRNDEQKYRKSIKQNLVHFEDHVREIKATAARIEFLIVLVTNAQDAIRSKKSLREAENITLFTYATVFFLPVGLAVSIFSMNGTPDHTVIMSMLVTASVALIVTACVLWCALNHLVPLAFRNSIGNRWKKQILPQKTPELENQGLHEEHPTQQIRTRLSFGHKNSWKFVKPTRSLANPPYYDIENQKRWNGEGHSVGGHTPSTEYRVP